MAGITGCELSIAPTIPPGTDITVCDGGGVLPQRDRGEPAVHHEHGLLALVRLHGGCQFELGRTGARQPDDGCQWSWDRKALRVPASSPDYDTSRLVSI